MTDFNAAQWLYYQIGANNSGEDCAPNLQPADEMRAIVGLQIINDQTGVPYPTQIWGSDPVVCAEPPEHSNLHAYVRYREGRYHVRVRDMATGEVRLDESYVSPVAGLSWHENGSRVEVRLRDC